MSTTLLDPPAPPAGFVRCLGKKVVVGDAVFEAITGVHVVAALVPYNAHATVGRRARGQDYWRHTILDGTKYWVDAAIHLAVAGAPADTKDDDEDREGTP